MNKTTALSIVLAFGAVATPALAATNAAKNRCSDAVRILRQQGSMPYKTQDVDPLKVEGVKAHLGQVMDSFERAKNQVKQIPQGEFVQDDPELQECWTTLRTWADYIMLVQLKMKQSAQTGATLGPFLDKAKPHTTAMLTLAAVDRDPRANVLGQATARQAKDMLDGLAQVDKECAALGADEASGPLDDSHGPGGNERRVAGVVFHDGFTQRSKNWCYVAKRRADLMATAAANRFVAVEGFGNYALVVPEAVKKLSAARPDLDVWVVEMLGDRTGFLNKREALAKAWNQEVGIAAAANSGIGAQLDELLKKVEEAAAQLPAPKGDHHDAELEGLAKTSLKRLFPEAASKASYMDAAGWTIEKNGLGVPLNRFRSGQLVFKRAAFKYCEQRNFSYNEVHQGGGSYAKGQVKILSTVRFVNCP